MTTESTTMNTQEKSPEVDIDVQRLVLPCPFCGGNPKLTQIGNAHTRKRGMKIKCPTLGCVEFRVCVIRYSLKWAEEKAREKWNTRKSLPNTPAQDNVNKTE